jgi:arylsulfatase A-like enzyme
VTSSKAQLKCKEGATRVVKDGKENYSTDVLADQVVAFVQAAAKDGAPFFIYFAPKAPHGPFLSPKRFQPDPAVAAFSDEAKRRLQGCELFDWKSRPPSFLEQDMSDKPEWTAPLVGKTTAAELDKTRKLQLVSVLATDDALKQITAALAAAGQADKTVLIYAGDNGYAWGEHWWHKKNCAYEGCARVPLVAYDPRYPQNGAEIKALTLNVDLTPTFAELAGVAVPTDTKVDGHSLASAIQGRGAPPPRDRVLFECWGGSDGPSTHAAARTERWKYVEHYDDDARTTIHVRKDGRKELELYDLQRDPYELENLAWLNAAQLAAKGYAAGEVEGVQKTRKAQLAALEVE